LRKQVNDAGAQGIKRQIVNEHEGKPRNQVESQDRRKRLARQPIPNRGRVYDKAGILVSNMLLYKLRREGGRFLHAQQLAPTAQEFRKSNESGVGYVQFT
jgi:hypothetical protein